MALRRCRHCQQAIRDAGGRWLLASLVARRRDVCAAISTRLHMPW